VNPIISVVRRYPLAIFVALAYLFSWAPMVFPVIEFPIGFGPFLAALVVLGLTVGRPGVKTLLGRMVRWRVGWRWWLVALGLPILLSGLASYLTVLLGAPAPSAEQLGAWPEVLVTFLIMLIVPGLGGAWEEPGWRGYALHRLEAGRSRLWALPPLWAIIVLWHLPLFVNGGIEWADVFNMVGGVVVYNWLYHRSGHSVLLVMVIHSMNNAGVVLAHVHGRLLGATGLDAHVGVGRGGGDCAHRQLALVDGDRPHHGWGTYTGSEAGLACRLKQ
jgi:hypothetical protein